GTTDRNGPSSWLGRARCGAAPRGPRGRTRLHDRLRSSSRELTSRQLTADSFLSMRIRRRRRAVLSALDLRVGPERVQVQPARLRVRRDGAVLAHVRDAVRVLVPDATRRDPALLRVLVDVDGVL